jgi:hypothetical protein
LTRPGWSETRRHITALRDLRHSHVEADLQTLFCSHSCSLRSFLVDSYVNIHAPCLRFSVPAVRHVVRLRPATKASRRCASGANPPIRVHLCWPRYRHRIRCSQDTESSGHHARHLPRGTSVPRNPRRNELHSREWAGLWNAGESISSSQSSVTSDALGLTSLVPSAGTIAGTIEIEIMATADTNAEQQFEVESIWTGVGVAVVSPSGPDILLDPDGTDPRNKLATGPASGRIKLLPY